MTQLAKGGKRKMVVDTQIHNRQATDLLRNAQVAPTIVTDPYGRDGEKIAVVRSIRDDILAEMHSRGEIDQAQFDAGRKYEKYAEQAEIGNVQAIDPGREAVDGGRGYDGITDSQIDAVRQLNEAARILGAKGEAIVRTVLIDRRRFVHLGLSDRATTSVRIRFMTYLDILAEFWGCATRTR